MVQLRKSNVLRLDILEELLLISSILMTGVPCKINSSNGLSGFHRGKIIKKITKIRIIYIQKPFAKHIT